ncbi:MULTISPECIES: aldo/keto reductase [Ensifer]|jgi:aryl-alcohol dehydrogenase-like predicted oxidoreductase|uniref:aldo/keto reductase n=1 Tax=Ensifer TaxID=106591 RepID=UPI000713CEC7|nr:MULTISPECIES: aldo/keto reductase [Ensifer]KQX51342.1 alcohol dehydrogenase [Ensifer sp. Root1298]KQX83707.1 alcohol dehydrogenase [Ensifer sp. Root1312]KRC20052.1 alcohol dehydrogenase [Ensifer sp. Root74]KRD63299.1 alcohol dehydrogenase [Ensifer sp. Root954]
MEYVRLGATGLKVSRLALGCMSFGEPDRGNHQWTLGEAEARPLFRKALDAGINFLDTANVYSDGTSEEIVGRLIKEHGRRDEVVLATKVFGRMNASPNGTGLSRKAILSEVDNSLRRLGTDYIDLYQTHFWDNDTPIEETLEALNDVVRAGKVRYVGASNMYAWQFATALQISKRKSWAAFASMQLHLNLIYREEEREMLPLCRAEGIGVMTFSPLARGILTKDSGTQSKRAETDNVTGRFYEKAATADQSVVDEVAKIARERNLPRAQVALAWVLQTPGVTCPIIGATKSSHLEDAIGALDVKLTDEEVKRLQGPYVPHEVVGLM